MSDDEVVMADLVETSTETNVGQLNIIVGSLDDEVKSSTSSATKEFNVVLGATMALSLVFLMLSAFFGEAFVNLVVEEEQQQGVRVPVCLLYTSPSPRDKRQSRMPSSA